MLAALMLMAALGALTFAATSLVMLESRQQETVRRGRLLRIASENAACRGLAELQARLGPDVAHDFESTPGGLSAVGKFDQVSLTGAAAEGSLLSRWEVADLSLGHDVAARSVAAMGASAWAKSPAGRAKLPHALAGMVTPGQSVALAAAGPDFFEPRQVPGASWQISGLLTDPVRGGWKKNLAVESALAEELGQPLASLLRSAAFVQSPAKGIPLARITDAACSLDTLPVLADLRLSMGFFNSRSDGRHRLRFHGSAVFWNRLTVPVLTGPQGKMFLVEFVGSPEVTVANLETQSSFVVDLDDCPQEDFGVIRQGLRERGLWFWAEVTDPTTYGMSGRGLLPGEVYALVNPAPATQPQGLARILTKTTWKMERAYHGPGWKRPEPTVFLPSDRIEIAVRFRGKVGIRLRPYAGEPTRDSAISDYPAKPLIVLDNITFPDFLIRTTGEDYSREDSSGYVIEERRACLRIRLRPREVNELWSAAAKGALSRSGWDFSNLADAAEWVVDHPVQSALDVVDHDASSLAGPLWDLRANRHDAGEPGTFASVRLRDVPNAPSLSVGSLRHLEAPGSTAWMGRLDRAFFGAPLEAPEPGVVSHHPFLIRAGSGLGAGSVDFARGLSVAGAFNVNSRDTKAWELFLGDADGAWKPDAGGPFEPQELSGRLFFTRTGGASLAKWGAISPVDLADRAVNGLPGAAYLGLIGQQAVRCLEAPGLGELARKIVELQPSHGWPYRSLESFARSRVLEHALEAASLDAPYVSASPELPIRLQAEDLLEAWAPVLTVRGDTFRVIGRAEGEGGTSVCEMVVQRIPEEHSAAHLGRRFRIISVRFRNR
ncbi:MAG: hypothetical protein EBR83_02050 [Verrucomicrobia bacterium]|nr:hypothetical protein [Verrucomicrobiota bacterium]